MNIFERQIQAKYAEVEQGAVQLRRTQSKENSTANKRKNTRRIRHFDSALGLLSQQRGR